MYWQNDRITAAIERLLDEAMDPAKRQTDAAQEELKAAINEYRDWCTTGALVETDKTKCHNPCDECEGCARRRGDFDHYDDCRNMPG